MDAEIRKFIENATLLFIASRSSEGLLDVSPRGGQPSVLRVADNEALLLPDYPGNRRLDTIGNLLGNPEVTLIIVNRGADRYLRVVAAGEASFRAEHLAAFPADENPPVSVLVLAPHRFDFVATSAFSRTGLWLRAGERKPPLNLGSVVRRDKEARADAGFGPVLKNAGEERLLATHGVREIYGTASEGVQTKVSDIAGPGGLAFMEEAQFIVVAHEVGPGRMAVCLTGEAPLTVIPFDNRHAYRLHLPAEIETAAEGQIALVTLAPGRSETLRVNGRFEKEEGRESNGTKTVKIVPQEVFFHCPASLNRARIWQEDRRANWTGRRRFICTERHRESPQVLSFVLTPADDASIGPIGPGQYVTVSLPRDPESSFRQRSYSVSGRPDERSLRISVRRAGRGGMSDLLHDTVEAGSGLLLGIPAGRFILDSPPGRRVVLIGAGVGTTPLLPMLEQLADDDSGREVWFVHAAHDGTHHLFRDEVRRISASAEKGRIRLFSAYSCPRDYDECDLGRRLDAAVIAELLPVADSDFYICGPTSFMASLHDDLVALGADPGSIRSEEFSAAALDLTGMSGLAECVVTFAKSGKTAAWTPGAGSLLDLALAHEVKVAYSCRRGDCQSCLQRVLGGAAGYPSGEAPVLAEDQILLCQAIPREDMIIDC